MLEDGHKREGDGRERWLALDMVEVCEVEVVKLGIERLADQAVRAVGFKMGGAPGGDFGRHLARRLWLQTHHAPPDTDDSARLIVAPHHASRKCLRDLA